MLKKRSLGGLSAGVLALAVLSCSDSSSDNSSSAGSAGTGGSAGEDSSAGSGGQMNGADAGGSGGEAGAAGTGGEGNMAGAGGQDTGGPQLDAGVADSGAPDAIAPDATRSDAGADADVDSGSPTVAFNCPTPAPNGVPDQVFAIESANLETGDVVIRNISGDPQVVTTAWEWCDFPGYGPLVATDTTFQPGATVTFNFNSSDPAGGEMGMFTSNAYTNSDAIRAYAAWGTGTDGTGGAQREPTAVGAALWSNGDRIAIAAGHVGFIATGASDTAAGYTSVPAECF